MKKLFFALLLSLFCLPVHAGTYTYTFVAGDISEVNVTNGYPWTTVTAAAQGTTGSAVTTTFDDDSRDHPSKIIKVVIPDTGTWANSLDTAVTNGETLSGITISHYMETVGVGELLDPEVTLHLTGQTVSSSKNDEGDGTKNYGGASDKLGVTKTLAELATPGTMLNIHFHFTYDRDRDLFDIKYDNLTFTIHTTGP